MLITAAHSRSLRAVAPRGVVLLEAQRRFKRWFRLKLRLRRHKVVVAVVVLGLVVGEVIVKVRTAGMITTVAIHFRVSTIYVRRAHDDLLNVQYGVSVGCRSSLTFEAIQIALFHFPATITSSCRSTQPYRRCHSLLNQ